MLLVVTAIVDAVKQFWADVIQIFGQCHLDEVAAGFGLPVLARLPIDPRVAECYDAGLMETVDTTAISSVVDAIEGK